MTAEQATGLSRSQHQRRRRILRAAAALASRGGVEAMQMRTVAERAGVALGTLYRYFPSKMDLVVAVVAQEMDTLEDSLERHPPRSATPTGRAIEVLTRATRGLMREPELADALIRSLLLSNVKTDFGDRLGDMLARAAIGADPASTSHPPPNPTLADPAFADPPPARGGYPISIVQRPSAPQATERDSVDNSAGERYRRERDVLFRSLSGIWVMEMIEMLRGHVTHEEVHGRLEIAAGRLLADV
jgi:TetR/AcrR family transcriptional regulator, cholesterol catabolism regulator